MDAHSVDDNQYVCSNLENISKVNISTLQHFNRQKNKFLYAENTAARPESGVIFSEPVEVFSPGALRRSEVGVARSAAGRGPDRTPGSGSQLSTARETKVGLT